MRTYEHFNHPVLAVSLGMAILVTAFAVDAGLSESSDWRWATFVAKGVGIFDAAVAPLIWLAQRK